ncbi:MAG: peptide chain release factor N(5)-glutamine methyltransferase [Candidatus Moranbacteria bacterium CG_4_9_14_3_um_filter_36_9]|nr:MAG: peptide chain release factor N(5)-glutamine methyltransferase [Candidatus Moranbacteria bacterium CG_4_9_14_3_um_filter_36_9]
MKEVWRKKIQSLLERGETEDLQGALALVSFHIDHSENKEVELEVVLSGIGDGIPIPYIIGYTLICGLKIFISRDVLNPGPETVTLIEKARECVVKHDSSRILDLCTGSGAVAIVLAQICSGNIIATDISEKALAIAKLNASENKVVINFMHGDLFGPVRGMVFDSIITNPPYVKSGAINLLPKFVRDFAPLTAIDGGDDGLFFHRAIISRAKGFLRPGGSLFIECEDNQDKEIEALAVKFGWEIRESFPNRHGNIRGFMLI